MLPFSSITLAGFSPLFAAIVVAISRWYWLPLLFLRHTPWYSLITFASAPYTLAPLRHYYFDTHTPYYAIHIDTLIEYYTYHAAPFIFIYFIHYYYHDIIQLAMPYAAADMPFHSFGLDAAAIRRHKDTAFASHSHIERLYYWLPDAASPRCFRWYRLLMPLLSPRQPLIRHYGHIDAGHALRHCAIIAATIFTPLFYAITAFADFALIHIHYAHAIDADTHAMSWPRLLITPLMPLIIRCQLITQLAIMAMILLAITNSWMH